MLSSDEQNEIMRQDRRRRRQREQQELIELYMNKHHPAEAAHELNKFTHANAELVRGIGMVCPPPKPRASVSSWERGMKRTTTVGVAPGADPANGPSMLVTYADGTIAVRYLGKSSSTKRGPSHSKDTTGVKDMPHKITAADMPAIGDTNH